MIAAVGQRLQNVVKVMGRALVNGLREILQEFVDDRSVPGAVGLVARGDRAEIAAVGSLAYGGAPMPQDAIFRIASITKPITAAAVMLLVDEGRIALDDPVGRWLPELANPMVVRTPASPVDDVVPAVRPITVFDLLSSLTGYGWASDWALPQVQRLFAVQRDGREPASYPSPDTWMAELAALPLLYQPGEAWLYDTSSTLQGVLVSRVSGQPLSDFLAERVFAPLGMTDSGFHVPPAKRDRFTSYYRPGPDGAPELADGPDGQWSAPPEFPLGHGGLAGTAADWLAFGQMLLAGGATADGRRLLSAESVRLMTTDHTSTAQRAAGQLFLDGQGWGFGGAVDITMAEPWNVPGRYGWVGGTGTSAHVIPSAGTVAILLTQVGVDSPEPVRCLPRFWQYAAAW